MLIVCPSCTTSYNIDPASLGAAGRTVRCARCKTSWFATGPNATVSDFVADVIAEAELRAAGASAASPAAADDGFSRPDHDTDYEEPSIGNGVIMPDDAPSIVPPMSDAGDPAADADEGFAARRERLAARRKTRRKSSKWTAVILVLLGFNVALVGARSEVVRYVPQTASLFAAIGLPVNLRHLNFQDIKISKDEHDGVSVLSIAGTIVSQSSQPVDVPPLRFAVRNASGQEIYVWTTRPGRSILEPGQKLAFHSRLASPPADASDLMVRFAGAGEARAAQPR
ncbi:MAG: Zinc finger-containing protein [Pseudolabrys sp.]|jgi:predicted Zn finger-like uncharacterized protein|nr:Zinc finger-containing protein [Pseudolabrys sp.]